MNAFLNFLTYHTPLFYLIQSIWRDEAFSYFMAKPNILKIIITTAQDFNPPLYYLLLHLWMYLPAGQVGLAGHSDIFLRLLSFIFHLIGVYYAYLIGDLLKTKRWAYYLAIFYFFNPMLLYYSFEMRMYSLFAMLSTAAIYYVYKKDFKNYAISSVLGLYTHSFFILIIFSIATYNFLKERTIKNLIKFLKPILYFIPWIPVLA